MEIIKYNLAYIINFQCLIQSGKLLSKLLSKNRYCYLVKMLQLKLQKLFYMSLDKTPPPTKKNPRSVKFPILQIIILTILS